MQFRKVDEFDNLEMTYISDFSGGYISRNKHVLEKLELNRFTRFILEKCVYGTPIFKLNGGSNQILLISGIHGNELPPQVASVKLLNRLVEKDLNNTIYFIPFASPKSTMNNERTFNAMDLNRSAHIKNSISNLIVQAIEELRINLVGDFHSTAYNSNPGREAVFSSKSPCPESFLLANYIAQDVGSEVIAFDFAGSSYKGAVEDVCNLKGVPAVTCEVLSPFASIGQGAVERSLRQMESFISCFGL